MHLISLEGWCIAFDSDFIYYIGNSNPKDDTYFKTDLQTTQKISGGEYLKVKCGIEKVGLVPFAEYIKFGNGEFLYSLFSDGIIYKYDRLAKRINEYPDIGSDTIYSITLDKNSKLWIACPTSNYIGQFSLETQEEIFKIGGYYGDMDVFNLQEEVRYFDNFIYVSDMGNKRICQIDIHTKEANEYLKFEDSVWEYGRFKNKEIVRLQSGIYVL